MPKIPGRIANPFSSIVSCQLNLFTVSGNIAKVCTTVEERFSAAANVAPWRASALVVAIPPAGDWAGGWAAD